MVSGDFQSLELDAVAANVRKLVLRLLNEPTFLGAAENLCYSHGHFGRYAALAVHQFGKRVARHPKGFGGAES